MKPKYNLACLKVQALGNLLNSILASEKEVERVWASYRPTGNANWLCQS